MTEVLSRSAEMLPLRLRALGSSPGTLLGVLLTTVATVAGAAWTGYQVVRTQATTRAHVAALQSSVVEAARLDGQLARFAFLPSLIETSDGALQLLENPDEEALRRAVSLYLRSANALAGADNLYLLSKRGIVLAAADFDRPGTPLGQDLSYRPYVQSALANGTGRFFGVGITSARAGYYQSYALTAHNAVKGVATVKVNLSAFEQEWRRNGDNAIVLDEYGVIILFARDDWRYRPVRPLSQAAVDQIATARRYGDANLSSLDWRIVGSSQDETQRIETPDGGSFVIGETSINDGLWRLMVLSDSAAVVRPALASGAISGLAALVVVLGAVVSLQRRREIAQQLAGKAALKSANDLLETKVLERTAELRSTQAELVHAEKLATLGQISAGIVHELNQPLAALQTVSDNAGVLVERGQLDEARDNLGRIGDLVGRLGRLTNQLRVFAYKAGDPIEPELIRKSVDNVLLLLRDRIRSSGVEIRTDVDARAAVLANGARLEQVLINIIANALDAVETVRERRIDIGTALQDGRCRIVIANSGPRIPEEMMSRLFDPFVTSKPPGKGLGLGLMLCEHIVRSLGGKITVVNREPVGAEFVVDFPATELPESTQ